MATGLKTVSLPLDLLVWVERKQKTEGFSPSTFVRHALEELRKEEGEEDD